jgi:hypothetical protein
MTITRLDLMLLTLAPGGRPFCRVHGEPLVYDLQLDAWQCPDFAICGTWVGLEHLFRRAMGEHR